MLDKLCQIYPDFKFTAEYKPKNQVFYIEDKINCSGEFLTSSLLDFYLKNGDGVIFVGLRQNYAHYHSISKRLGNNIEPYIASDLLTYIDFFNNISDWIPEDLPLTEETTIFWNAKPPKVIDMKIENDTQGLLEKLYKVIQEQLSKKKGTPCIVIDNLTVFLELGVSKKDIVTFLSKIIGLMKSSENKASFYYTATPELFFEDQKHLGLFFKKNCDFHFEIYPNPTGYSADVHGQFRSTCMSSADQKNYTYKFKLFENKVELFESLDKF